MITRTWRVAIRSRRSLLILEARHVTLAEEDIELQLHAERRYFESCVTSPITPSAAHYQSAELDFMTTSLSLMLFRMWSFASNGLGRGIR